jgi:hypothetical protein
MTDAAGEGGSARAGRAQARYGAALTNAAKAAGPPLLFGLRLWASVCLALYIAFWLQLDNPYWAGTSAAIVCQPHLGASLRKGWYRMVGTVIGAIAIVVLTALFPQARAPFLIALALWAAVCALVATLLRNFAAYSAALAGYTAAIIAGDELGATGGPDANSVFLLAVYRANEICVGIVSAGIVLAGTDFGAARRRLAGSFAALSAEIIGRFTNMLVLAGPEMPETQPVRRDLVRRVIALDPLIDMVKGESSQLRYHSPVLQKAVDGLFSALVGWRTVAVALARLPDGEAQRTHCPLTSAASIRARRESSSLRRACACCQATPKIFQPMRSGRSRALASKSYSGMLSRNVQRTVSSTGIGASRPKLSFGPPVCGHRPRPNGWARRPIITGN